ncbi:MAG: hypothetical protein CMB82_08810 [Flammeovirgaceae bacterium]|nr:hypothetical protein [Flammeovirgaceae bacterium]|tara:strand:- start:8528 stop:8917 length:390 start_codon:yes stop_codon:yes gene_type:complete
MKNWNISIFMSVIFILFAFLNLNDPDPLLWVSLYVFIGVVHLLGLIKKYLPSPFNHITTWLKFYLIISLSLLFYGCFYIPDLIIWLSASDKMDLVGKMKAEKSYIEGTRELGGLLIASMSMGYQYFSQK